MLKVYRGGNSASTPCEKAYSWSLDINVANFFACRHGFDEGYIVKGEVAKEDVIEAFLDDRGEEEIVVAPEHVKILDRIPIKGAEFIKPILPEIAPMYRDYRDRMESLVFAQDSDVHGSGHEARVLLLSLIIAHYLGLPARDRKVLAAAAIFHDTQRTNDDVDSTHGKTAREYYQTVSTAPDPLVGFLCEYHCLPDEMAYQEIRNNRKLSKERSRSRLLLNVFKDADALDRVRFGLRGIDINQLRLPISKELSLAARICLEQVQVERSKVQANGKIPLDWQLRQAAARANEAIGQGGSGSKGQGRGEGRGS